MISMIQTVAKFCTAIVALATFLPATPSYAETFAFVSPDGGGLACTSFSPCLSVAAALSAISPPVRVMCISGAGAGTGVNAGGATFSASNVVVDIDCPQATIPQLVFSGPNATVRVHHFNFRNGGLGSQIIFDGSGILILEDCTFEDAPGSALDIEPNGPLKLVIKNSRISNSGSGVLLKPSGSGIPAAGGFINATFDHVTITNNSGGGIKTDSTNGVVNLDITDSEISNNGGNGINLVGANQNMLNLSRSVIAKNGVAGLQANGAATAALVDTTLFDTNTSGATSVVGGGRLLTYGNNRIVGTAGSGFTGSASLQ
jgi:hypothetical protein